LFDKLSPKQGVRTFSEHPTRPLDAEKLARALAGEGRHHISTGCARLVLSKSTDSKNSLYLLTAQSDGLNTLPDFGIVGVADNGPCESVDSNPSNVALSVFANQMTQKAVLDFLELDGFERSSPLQNMVFDAMAVADQAVSKSSPNVEYSLTAGLIFAEIMILGHIGNTRAYHIDRHHIERITVAEWKKENPSSTTAKQQDGDHDTFSNSADQSGEGYEGIMVYSRPVPRDGYILLSSGSLWKNISERDIHNIVLEGKDPQVGCQALISRTVKNGMNQDISILLLYFPPDFGPWR
jgi:serine/threonine protein phosphatase PrpC